MSVSHLYTMINHSITSPSQLLANNLAKVVQGVSDLLLLLDISGVTKLSTRLAGNRAVSC